MTPGQIKALLIAVGAALLILGAYFAVDAYNTAIEDAALLKKQVAQYEQVAKENQATIKQLRDNATADAEAAEVKTVERQKAADTLVKDTKEYHSEIAKAPQTDIDCARRTVPAAVDRLLSD